MKYLSVAETAAKWQISERSVRNYCAQGRAGSRAAWQSMEYSGNGSKTGAC